MIYKPDQWDGMSGFTMATGGKQPLLVTLHDVRHRKCKYLQEESKTAKERDGEDTSESMRIDER